MGVAGKKCEYCGMVIGSDIPEKWSVQKGGRIYCAHDCWMADASARGDEEEREAAARDLEKSQTPAEIYRRTGEYIPDPDVWSGKVGIAIGRTLACLTPFLVLLLLFRACGG